MIMSAILAKQGRQVTVPFRMRAGAIIWAWCRAADDLGIVDIHAETLYRKLMQHDRVTMDLAPWLPFEAGRASSLLTPTAAQG